MKTSIDKEFFVFNRKRVIDNLPPKTLAVFNSNDLMPTNSDGSMKFRQNSDLFYLTGVSQPETVLLICPGSHDPKLREVLFVRETNEHIMTWEGRKLSKEEASNLTGIQTVHWLSEFERVYHRLAIESTHIYLNSNENSPHTAPVQTRDRRFALWSKEKYPLHSYGRLAPIMESLRSIKHEVEIDMIRKACQITGQGFERILRFVKPGVNERHVEAELAHEFIYNGWGFADYLPIIASGANSLILHYEENNAVCQDGDLLLLDFGASFSHYNADMTRTIPVNGRFTARQRAVYDAVVRILRHTRAFFAPGKTLAQVQEECENITEQELLGLGLLSSEMVSAQSPDKKALKKYFMHGVSHFLGLDVHDVGFRHEPIQPGMVFTIEPGIYIREEGFGIRLENNVYISETGAIDLMEDIPLDADHIEEIMNS